LKLLLLLLVVVKLEIEKVDKKKVFGWLGAKIHLFRRQAIRILYEWPSKTAQTFLCPLFRCKISLFTTDKKVY